MFERPAKRKKERDNIDNISVRVCESERDEHIMCVSESEFGFELELERERKEYIDRHTVMQFMLTVTA